MAFVPAPQVYRLVFDDAGYAGLEVRARAGSVGQYMDIARLADIDLSPPYSADMLEPVYDLFKTFCSVLESWNIEQPAGKPVPPDFEGLKTLDLTLAMGIIHAWMAAVSGEAVPLERTDLEASIPMDVNA